LAIQQSGHQIAQVYSRTAISASRLAQLLGVPYTTQPEIIVSDADIYFYAVSDDALDVLTQLQIAPDALHVHTAGSVAIEVFKGRKINYGVLYPLQTFSKNKQLDLSKIPIFIESSAEEIDVVLYELAKSVSEHVYRASSAQRLKLHVSAVFASNYVNYLYQLASEIVKSANLPFDVLKPLILETAEKVMILPPDEAQTGPAKRKDQGVINKHLEVLKENPDLMKLYQDLSDMIMNQYFHQS
jgi:predicted short-subunit dehydrogenase-like oxidoreductase (DUF2520 family)